MINAKELKLRLKILQHLKDEVVTFEKPLLNSLSYPLSALFDKAYGSIRDIEIYENPTLLQLRITAKSQIEKTVILNKETINSDVSKYKPVLLSVLKNCIKGLQKVLLEP